MPQVVNCPACYHHPAPGMQGCIGEVYNRLLVCRGEGSSPSYGSHPGDWADMPTSPAHGNSKQVAMGIISESVQVKLELGHKAVLRKKPTTEGFTHDWTVYVRGPEGSNISHFVDKIVFHLHDSFRKPKRSLKEPPYQVSESGYGGFTLPIEIYFKNKEEPRKIRFEYDLFLHLENCPPVNHIRCEKLTFQNPTDEFRRKLLKAGGVGLPGPNDPMPAKDSQPNGTPTPASVTPENRTFNELFGAPLKSDSTSASKKHKSSSKDKVSGKPGSHMSSGMMSSGSSTPSSTGHTGKDPKSTPTSTKDKAALKRPSESTPPSKTSKKKRKDKDKDRDKDRERKDGEKSKHKKHKKKDKKDNEQKHAEESITESRPVQGLKSPKKPPPPPAPPVSKPADSTTKYKPPAQLRPFDEEVLSTGEQSDSNMFNDVDEFPPADQMSNASTHSFSSLKHSGSGSGGNKPLNTLMKDLTDDSQSEDDDILSPPVRQSPPSLVQQPPSLVQQPQEHVSLSHSAYSQIPVLEREKNEKTPPPKPKKEKSYKKSKHDKSKGKESGKQRDTKDSRKEHESSEKENKVDNDNDDNDSGVEPGHPSMDVPNGKPPTEEKAPNGEYLTALLQLQRSLMTLTDAKILQQVVQIIRGTGQFKISDATFDFDLCCLDAKTVRRLNDLISNGMCS